MSTWYTSDLHLGHDRIIELCDRPFTNVDEMNGEIIRRWNEVVDPTDTVFVLGDVCMGRIAYTLPLVRTLNGNKKLVPGNHDRCFHGYYSNKSLEYQRSKLKETTELYLEFGFETVYPNQLTYKNGLNLCHFPVSGDSQDEDRFVEYRPKVYDDDWLIHGHVHNAWKVNGHQINVGVDVWNFYPVHEKTIKNIIDAETRAAVV